MAAAEVKALVEQMPAAGGDGMYNTNIDKDKINQTTAEIHKGGKEFILGIIDMLTEPKLGQEVNDVKPHYALHCLANYALVIKDEKARKEFGETLASQIGGDRPKGVQSYLCEQLQWAGARRPSRHWGRCSTMPS